MMVDGMPVLKLNNYDLEGGERSVFDQELNRARSPRALTLFLAASTRLLRLVHHSPAAHACPDSYSCTYALGTDPWTAFPVAPTKHAKV